MNRIDPWFSRHAYMLEFRNTNDFGWNKDTQVFTFSLPPENEQFTKSQRLNYTKTFGGAVIDDYGNDLVKITLSGTTGNSDLKTIFRGNNKPATTLSGEDELLYLDKLIDDYGKYDNLKNKTIFLYDLGKLNFKSIISTPPYWEVKIDSFKWQRDKSRPTFYKYTLELTGFKPTRKFSFLENSKIKTCLNVLNTIANVIVDIFGTTTSIIDSAYLLKDEIDTFLTEYEKYESLVNGIVNDITTDIKNDYIHLGEWRQDEKTIVSNTNTENTNDDNYDSKVILTNSAQTIQSTGITLQANTISVMQNMPIGQLDTISQANGYVSYDEFESVTYAMLDELNVNIEFLVSSIKELQQIAYFKGIVYFGKKIYVAKSTSTYESISLEIYNSVDYADVIRVFNNSIELEPGLKIETPILTQRDSIIGNEVVKPIEDIDEYGKDICLDEFGEMKVDYSNGDLMLISESKNLEQAIKSRLSTEMGTRIRDIIYGIQSSIGETNAITAFLYSSIYQTILEDPRVRSIEYIRFEGNGDALYFEISYTSKIGEKNTMGGQI